jgi:hypothetical protein
MRMEQPPSCGSSEMNDAQCWIASRNENRFRRFVICCNISQKLRAIVHALFGSCTCPAPVPVQYSRHRYRRLRRGLVTAGVIAGALAASAILNRQLAKKAQRDNPPTGRFLEVDGVRIHYVERGAGRPLVFFHGNGSMIQDFDSSGLIELAAENYRVIVFDRPGYGHSDRPRNVVWTPAAQAELFFEALQQLGVHSALVFGHSWGASVAVSLA